MNFSSKSNEVSNWKVVMTLLIGLPAAVIVIGNLALFIVSPIGALISEVQIFHVTALQELSFLLFSAIIVSSMGLVVGFACLVDREYRKEAHEVLMGLKRDVAELISCLPCAK